MTTAKAWGIDTIPELTQALNNMCTGKIAQAIECLETYLSKYTKHNYVDTDVSDLDVVIEYGISDANVCKAIRDLWQFATRPKRNGQLESDRIFILNAIDWLELALVKKKKQ